MHIHHVLTRIVARALLCSGLATAGFALAAGTAHAQPAPAPQVYWCPNQPWNPAWGENKYWNQCWDTDHPP
ncbi:MAG TPA: pilin, partial [Mycobacterium sp.]|nr:pilin [Mycobacterium sp.]